MDDAVTRYRAASEANDIAGVMATLAPDAEVVSPISGRMVFRGHDDLRILLSAIYGAIDGLRWHDEVGEGDMRVVLGDATVGPFPLGDAMVFELAEDGRIRRYQAAPATVAGTHAAGPEARAAGRSPPRPHSARAAPRLTTADQGTITLSGFGREPGGAWL